MSLVNIGGDLITRPNPTCLENGGLSYRLHLEQLAQYSVNSMDNYAGVGHHLDTRKQCQTCAVEKLEGGWFLRPTELYVATVKELIHSKQQFMPWVQLDPTLSTRGVTVHNAGFMERRGAQIPFELVFSVLHMVKVYPGDVVARVFFHDVKLR